MLGKVRVQPSALRRIQAFQGLPLAPVPDIQWILSRWVRIEGLDSGEVAGAQLFLEPRAGGLDAGEMLDRSMSELGRLPEADADRDLPTWTVESRLSYRCPR